MSFHINVSTHVITYPSQVACFSDQQEVQEMRFETQPSSAEFLSQKLVVALQNRCLPNWWIGTEDMKRYDYVG